MITGYAPGAYDLFHVGHLNLLRRAAERCDRLVAGVVDDDVLEVTKGIRPVVPVAERVEIVAALSIVADAVVEDVTSKFEMWERLRFDVLFKGDDWRGTAKGRALEESFAPVGVEIVYLPYTMHTSSTRLRQALARLDGGASARAAGS